VNPTIQERYVGSCWDTHKRNTKHKSSCHNTKSKKYNYPVYKFIRENGGYDNWYMETLDCVDCEDHELVEYEQHYIDIHGGIDFLLNDHDAVQDKEQRKEKMNISSRDGAQRNIETKRFYCECCDHAFPFNANLQKHFTTNKHKQTQQTYDFLSEIDNSCIF
tara:strand:+ start:94 stop:579 length:486 start_codon:yes stop_codon:yes gene_type:complete